MKINSSHSIIIISNNLQKDLQTLIRQLTAPSDKIFIIVDENTRTKCLPIIKKKIKNANIIEIKSGEVNKSIDTVINIWNYLINNRADRKSLIINLGGGMICDIGGFAASTFKRGINFINIPTTLLAQVDAAIGGKAGINFNQLKNEIGFFNFPEAILINTLFLKTLDKNNLISGFAEIIKHSLIHSKKYWDEIKQTYNDGFHPPKDEKLKKIISRSIEIKNHFVQNDFKENNIRKALNFGHTIGHSFESLSLIKNKPVLHGEAVACGMVCEAFLSYKKLGLSYEQLTEISNFIIKVYGKYSFTSYDYNKLFELIEHDKKQENKHETIGINFTLISEIGKAEINHYCKKQEIFEAFDYYIEI